MSITIIIITQYRKEVQINQYVGLEINNVVSNPKFYSGRLPRLSLKNHTSELIIKKCLLNL